MFEEMSLSALGLQRMATFVIVHGAWGGGWEWRSVADALAARGHRTFTPTLTGLGERSHLLSRSIGLHTHAEDVAQLIRWERARDVLLVGHSYGGMVTTMAASMIADVKAMIYVDAFTHEPGQREIDLLDAEWVGSMLLEPARQHGDGWLVPFPLPDDLDAYPPDVAERYRTARQPLATFTDPAETYGSGRCRRPSSTARGSLRARVCSPVSRARRSSVAGSSGRSRAGTTSRSNDPPPSRRSSTISRHGCSWAAK